MADLGTGNLVQLLVKPVTTTLTWFDWKVSGVVMVDSVVASRRVLLIDRKTLQYVKSAMSGSDGGFTFRKLPEQGQFDFFTSLAFDDRNIYDAEVMDFIKAVRVEETN